MTSSMMQCESQERAGKLEDTLKHVQSMLHCAESRTTSCKSALQDSEQQLKASRAEVLRAAASLGSANSQLQTAQAQLKTLKV